MKGEKMENNELLYLSEEDTIRAGLLDIRFCVDNAEEVFRTVTRGDYLMGGPSENEHGIRICFPKEKRFSGMPVAAPGYSFMAMPAYVGGSFGAVGEKWYGASLQNLKKNLPRAYHMVMLNDLETGRPLALLTAPLLSAARSGAAPGVAMRYLCHDGCKKAALVGAGLMNRFVILALFSECPGIESVQVYDIDGEKCKAYCREMSEFTGREVSAAGSMEEALRDADIVHTGQSNSFVLKKAWLKEGAVLLISSDVELEQDILCDAQLVFDHKAAHDIWIQNDPQMGLPTFDALRLMEAGAIPADRVCDLGDVIEGRRLPEGVGHRIFYWMGMPVSDIALAAALYQNALDKKIGTKLRLWDKPLWK